MKGWPPTESSLFLWTRISKNLSAAKTSKLRRCLALTHDIFWLAYSRSRLHKPGLVLY